MHVCVPVVYCNIHTCGSRPAEEQILQHSRGMREICCVSGLQRTGLDNSGMDSVRQSKFKEVVGIRQKDKQDQWEKEREE